MKAIRDLVNCNHLNYGRLKMVLSMNYGLDVDMDSTIDEQLAEKVVSMFIQGEQMLGGFIDGGIIGTQESSSSQQMVYTHGSLRCPHCGSMGEIFADGTAKCSNCYKRYRYA